MWIAVAVPAAIVVGMVVWWLRRDPVGGDAADQFEVERKWPWELRLTPEAQAAFMEGLRAYNDAGNRLAVVGEQGVLTTYDPPRLISLHLLADVFAARGDAALHDPQETVTALMDRLAGAERPGVLHLRPGWLSGEVDGMDRARFTEAVRDIVCGAQAEGVVSRSVDETIGALQVAVLGDPSAAQSEEPAHVNGRPVPEMAGSAAAAVKDRPDEMAGPTTAAVKDRPDEMAGPTTAAVKDRPDEMGGPTTAAVKDRRDEAPGSAAAVVKDRTDEAPVPDGTPSGRVNTMMLDLARVLDRYREARGKQPDATPEALLREVLPRLIASGGPGLTWTRPPSQDDLRIVLAGTGSPGSH
ncbi:hypothetical protein E1292_19535 [Nonomuraea deserti]|uniref:Uncharacterized protein n=1 Tax=Nonomuraea deserti TaxID=1848322 RepID=A0A4R4VF33_9ACTN|nr:hypothetical protein [Nonomuraea deserti]TDD04158.1 hypothetical protein E1292_19535 [Nonomuraea deserti]